ncbi:MAG: hypothetical protein COV67_02320 [Nitrospinae bacterium CG11_big_fil_rev_8_21_14_0_20_56_8]|nr:MAG: hypothetical protein COV67_02320 [Nitrospinae bacterium CG11_big_fil_rev_8_21_14_0_20_56_8]
MKKHLISWVIFTLAGVVLLSILWEFRVEQAFLEFVFNEASTDTLEDHLELVIMVTLFTAIALTYPTRIALRAISDLQKREETERKNKERFKSYFDLPLIGIAITTPRNEWLEVNDRLCSIFGYSRDELTRMKWTELTPPDDRANDVDLFNRVLEGNSEGYSTDKRFIRKNGEIIHASIHARCIRKENGQADYFVTVVQDITDRVRATEELNKYRTHLEELVSRSTAELKATHRQLLHTEKLSATGKLAANIAHELSNPLHGIRNVLNKIRRKVLLDPKYAEYLDLALSESERVSHLIQKLRDLHRPTSDVMGPVDLHETIDAMLLLMADRFAKRNISIEKNFAPHLPHIHAVSDQVRQVILNLLQNADEAITHEKGCVHISTSLQPSHVHISILDNGHGILPADIEYIFDPFFTTKKTEGTGLGLSVSYGIVSMHQGTIQVNSIPGKETTFTVIIPIHPEGCAT